MESVYIDLITRTLPDYLKEQGRQLIDSSKRLEEKRLKGRHRKFQKHRQGSSEGDDDTEEVKLKRKIKAEEAAFPIAIARLIIELWSPRMRKHAENIILQKAIQENYLEEKHLQWIHILETDKVYSENEWVIENTNDTIIELIWEKFDIKEHYSQVKNHRLWVQRSYDRLKEFVPSLHPEIIERHDLSKFAFSQAIGYCLKWVHSTHHDIWTVACDLHVYHEPHHPQCWNNQHAVEDKRKKLENWLRGACDFSSGCPYGIDLVSLDLESEDLGGPFLLESFIDMVGVEWERKKGQNLDISTRDLVYMDDRFLKRYSNQQHQIMSGLMEKIIAADVSWKHTTFIGREKLLFSIVPKSKHALFICQNELQKKYDEKRMKKLVKKKTGEQTEEGDIILSQELIDKARDNAFYIMVSRVVMELWDESLRKRANDLILKKAIEDKILTSHFVDWIMIFDKEESKTNTVISEGVLDPLFDDNALIKLIWEDFKLRDHFNMVQVHRHWIRQSYQRLAKFMPEITEEMIERHDLTKFALSQSMGYTLKWVHDLNYPIWRKSCNIHLNGEPHHPQMWNKRHTPEQKKSNLETWLCKQDPKHIYGFDLNSFDFTSENMARVFLVESLLDMVAVEWERKKNQAPNLTYTQLVYMEDRFLGRYTDHDKAIVEELMNVIRKADDQQGEL